MKLADDFNHSFHIVDRGFGEDSMSQVYNVARTCAGTFEKIDNFRAELRKRSK